MSVGTKYQYTVIFTLIAVLPIAISGCATSHFMKEVDVWEKGKALLDSGSPVEKLLSCSEPPFKQIGSTRGTEFLFGATGLYSGASTWCVLSVTVEGGIITGYQTRSGNPGGFTDGTQACAYIVERCVSDGMLRSHPFNFGTIRVMTNEADAMQAQSYGESARDAALASLSGTVLQMSAIQLGSRSPGTINQTIASFNTNGSTTPTSTIASSSQTQTNVRKASDVVAQKESSRNSWKPNPPQGTKSPAYEGADASEQTASRSPKPKYVSKDATHCVEVVPKGFKCDGPFDRFLTNICMTRITVSYRLGSDPWGMQDLAPKGCSAVSPFRDQRGVQFMACSWDPQADYGPFMRPCHY